MTDPLTPDDLARMRAKHIGMEIGLLGLACAHCGNAWPCDFMRLLDEVERLRKVVD